MLESSNSGKCIVGPSHIVRWQYLFNNTLTKLPRFDTYAVGGLPIWDENLLTFLKDAEHRYDEIYVLVGDFRFGNGCFDKNNIKKFGISKENINDVNDSILFKRCLNSLDELSKLKGVKLIFWDLYLREFINKKSGRYTNNGRYNHPLWNYSFVQDRYYDKTISLDELDNLNLEHLYIDSSLHPSILGYNFLFNVITGQAVTVSFLSSLRMKHEIDKKLHLSKPTIITGNGVFFRIINLYLSKGIFSVNASAQLSRADDALFTKREDDRRLIVFSESKDELELMRIKSYLGKSNWKDKVLCDLSDFKKNIPSTLIFEITNDMPSFLFFYAAFHHAVNEYSHDEFDIYSYQESLNQLFIRNCLCLS